MMFEVDVEHFPLQRIAHDFAALRRGSMPHAAQQTVSRIDALKKQSVACLRRSVSDLSQRLAAVSMQAQSLPALTPLVINSESSSPGSPSSAPTSPSQPSNLRDRTPSMDLRKAVLTARVIQPLQFRSASQPHLVKGLSI